MPSKIGGDEERKRKPDVEYSDDYMKKQFKTGKLKATEVGQCARAVNNTLVSVGASIPKELKELNCGEKHPGNAHRDLMKRLSRKCKMPPLYRAKARNICYYSLRGSGLARVRGIGLGQWCEFYWPSPHFL